MTIKKISVLGCGWLGFPLAASLLKKGFLIHGSTTSLEKIDAFKNAGIVPFQINLLEDRIEGEVDAFLEKSEILIIDIPPKVRGDSKENFVVKIKNLIPHIEKSKIKKVLFISSTSVYSDTYPISTFTEDSKPQPDTESGKQLLTVEILLQNNSKFETTILRFGGLIGNDRHPIHFLSGRKNIENPNGPINLIQKTDCIEIIKKIIETNSWNETFNATSSFHPTRKEYYTQKAIELNLQLPEFNESKISVGKIIKGDKIAQRLDYFFQNS